MNLFSFKLAKNEKYANIGSRFLASIIDMGILGLPSLLAILAIVKQNTWQEMLSMGIILFALIIFPMSFVSILYYPLFLSRQGKTIGKAILGLKVTNEKGKLLDFKAALFREFIAKPVSLAVLGIGFLALAFDKKHQAWHDKFTGSFVHVEEKRTFAGFIMLVLLLATHLYFIWQILSRVFSLLHL